MPARKPRNDELDFHGLTHQGRVRGDNQDHFLIGSLQRRLRNCLIGMRAEAYPYGAPELVELEQYLMWRARGMKIESPGVRP